MKFNLQLGKRSQLARGGQYLVASLFLALAIAILCVEIQPAWIKWLFCFTCLGGMTVLSIWRSADKAELEHEDLIEVARSAIQSEAKRLDHKRADLEKVLMAYGEWMEFPDFENLQAAQWEADTQISDERITKILDEQSDKMLSDFASGVYWEDGKFQTRELLIELFNFVEKIAQLYNPGAERPILETNLESLLKAMNRASLQVILLLEELPILDVKEMNLRKATDSVRKASKVYKKYEEIQPLLEPMRYLWQSSKFLMHSNPLAAAGWIAGSEILWKGGKKIGKKAMDAYLLSLVRQSLGILAWETAGIYDKSYRYRNADWIYGLELTHLASKFEPTTELLRAVFKELGSLPLRSSYDRIFLYRCVANHVSPKPDRFPSSEWLDVQTANEIDDRLTRFSDKSLHEDDRHSTPYKKWRQKMQERLGVTSNLEIIAE